MNKYSNSKREIRKRKKERVLLAWSFFSNFSIDFTPFFLLYTLRYTPDEEEVVKMSTVATTRSRISREHAVSLFV